jgi:hypothetical protein
MANYGVQKKQLQISESLAERAASAAKAMRTQAAATIEATVAGFGFTNVIGGASSALTKIANIIPGIGLAGIFGMAINALAPLVNQLNLFNSELLNTGEKAKTLLNAFSSSEYIDAIKNVQELTVNLALAKEGVLSKEGVLKQYNETIGKTTGKVTSLDEAEAALIKNGSAFIQMTLLKAAAQLSLSEAAQQSLDAEKERQRNISNNITAEESPAAYAGVPLLVRLKDAFNLNTDALKEYNKTQVAELKKGAEKSLSVFEQLQTEAVNIAKEFKLNFYGDTDDPKKTKLTDAQKAELELQKRFAKLKVEGQAFAGKLVLDGFKRNIEAEKSAIEKEFAGLDKVLTEKDPLDNYFKKRNKANIDLLTTPFQKLKIALQTDILPQLSTSFKTFFDDLLMNGKLSFESLGQAIKNTFLSVLASEATKGVVSLLSSGSKEDKKGVTPLISGIATFLK